MTTQPTLLYGLAFVWPTGFLVVLAMMQSPRLGCAGAMFWVLLVLQIRRSLSQAEDIIRRPTGAGPAAAAAEPIAGRAAMAKEDTCIGNVVLWLPLALMVFAVLVCLDVL